MDDMDTDNGLLDVADSFREAVSKYVRQSSDHESALNKVTSLAFFFAKSYGVGEDRETLLNELSAPSMK